MRTAAAQDSCYAPSPLFWKGPTAAAAAAAAAAEASSAIASAKSSAAAAFRPSVPCSLGMLSALRRSRTEDWCAAAEPGCWGAP